MNLSGARLNIFIATMLTIPYGSKVSALSHLEVDNVGEDGNLARLEFESRFPGFGLAETCATRYMYYKTVTETIRFLNQWFLLSV